MTTHAVAALMLLLATAASVDAQSSSWTEPMDAFQIGEDLYYVGTAGLGSFLFTSREGHVLLDVPLAENVPHVVRGIRALGFDPTDVRVQITSHAHYDHVGGVAAMGEITGAQLVVSAADAPFMESGRDFGLEGVTDGYAGARVDRTLGHLETVRVGDVTLTAHLTPGHTPGCTTWSGETVIDGEARTFVVACSLSVLSYYRIVGDEPTYEGQGADYCRSVQRLRALSPEVFLAAHGEFFGLSDKRHALRAGDPSAFVEREQYVAYVEGAAVSIERALAEQGHVGGCASLIG